MTGTIAQLLHGTHLVPVITVPHVHQAVPLANALLAAGIQTLEVTLRTDAALEAIEAIAHGVPEMLVGAGSVIDPQQMQSVANAGGRYAVSPGYTEALLAAACLPYLPGASTAAEVLSLRERGYFLQKFFPAEAAGGLTYLDAIHAPIPDVGFCPTGGLNAELAAAYLQRPYVKAVGGSWFIPKSALESGGFAAITRAASGALKALAVE
jgi:2-dehydro-3-deoxyphosphogluconate aldolase/(4S)-4-hydroxy-2-oxoglutarate aldolase